MSKWPRWLPFVGVRRLEISEILDFGLDPEFEWRGLLAEWFGYGFMLAVFAKTSV